MKRAEKSHYQCEVFVCVSTNRVDAVDRLLILVSLGQFWVILSHTWPFWNNVNEYGNFETHLQTNVHQYIFSSVAQALAQQLGQPRLFFSPYLLASNFMMCPEVCLVDNWFILSNTMAFINSFANQCTPVQQEVQCSLILQGKLLMYSNQKSENVTALPLSSYWI